MSSHEERFQQLIDVCSKMMDRRPDKQQLLPLLSTLIIRMREDEDAHECADTLLAAAPKHLLPYLSATSDPASGIVRLRLSRASQVKCLPLGPNERAVLQYGLSCVVENEDRDGTLLHWAIALLEKVNALPEEGGVLEFDLMDLGVLAYACSDNWRMEDSDNTPEDIAAMVPGVSNWQTLHAELESRLLLGVPDTL